ncbi:ABC transporter ATP-binding protein [Devosia sp. XK-2]|uniref:ABC transporter ATP-binding protein n=1 Tax=Devosia sp. XK-2 TaxID=3126689 RepID=UPI0030D54840
MILRLAGVSKRFGAVVVADNIDLEVARGEALGIIGANGAGKSSLFNLITGVITPDAGIIQLADRDLTRVPLRERCVAGIGRSFQIPRPFESLTVFENLLVAAEYGREHGYRGAVDLCGRILDQTGLAPYANTLAGKLTLLNRKRLEMARALATEPDIMLLDEIAGGLTEAECRELVSFIKQLNQAGVTIVWIEHVVHALLSVVSRLIVLEFGRKIADGEPMAVMNDPEVRRSYLGIDEETAA